MNIDLNLAGLDLSGEEVEAEVPDALTKFFEQASLGAFLGPGGHAHAHNLAVESAPLHANVAARYKKIAETVTGKNPPAQRLEKRAHNRVVKTEETTIGDSIVVAELDENDIVIRTYRKN